MIFTQNQQQVIDAAVDWYRNSSELTFQISGNPGTGKSTILKCIIEKLGLSMDRIAPMAFIGAAAIVMRQKGFYNAKTIHSWLLEPVKDVKKDKSGNDVMNEYFNIPELGIRFIPKMIFGIDLFVVDEAGSVPLPLRKVIEMHKIKTIAVGDIDQLPPVKYESAYLTSGKIHYLTEIFRQSEGSGIIYLSQRLKRGLPIHYGYYGDCSVIHDYEVTDNMILSSDVLICGKNDTRDGITRVVRENILHIDSDLPQHGERLVCRKNNWGYEIDGISLANGLIGEVYNYPDMSNVTKDGFYIDFKPMMLNSPFRGLLVDFNYFKAPFKDKYKLKYGRFSKGEKMEYAYAITTHIAQGGEFANGMYFQEYLNPSINNQLHYTGITRFSNYCIYVKKARKYY